MVGWISAMKELPLKKKLWVFAELLGLSIIGRKKEKKNTWKGMEMHKKIIPCEVRCRWLSAVPL